jgi:hypothetical protein
MEFDPPGQVPEPEKATEYSLAGCESLLTEIQLEVLRHLLIYSDELP